MPLFRKRKKDQIRDFSGRLAGDAPSLTRTGEHEMNQTARTEIDIAIALQDMATALTELLAILQRNELAESRTNGVLEEPHALAVSVGNRLEPERD